MNPIEALGIAFWVIIFAIVIGVVAKGGWPGLVEWVAAKFGPVGTSTSSGSTKTTPTIPGTNVPDPSIPLYPGSGIGIPLVPR